MSNFLRATALLTIAGFAAAAGGCTRSGAVGLMYYKDRHGNIIGKNGAKISPKASHVQAASSEQSTNGHWETPGEVTWVPKSGRDAKGKMVYWNEPVYPERVWVEHPAGSTQMAASHECELIAGRFIDNGPTTKGLVQLAKESGCTVEKTTFQESMVEDRTYTELGSDLIRFGVGVNFEVTNRKADQTTNTLSGGNATADAEVGDVSAEAKQNQQMWQKQEANAAANAAAIAKAEAEAKLKVEKKKNKHNRHDNGHNGGCKKKDKQGNDTCFFNKKTGELVTSINGERISNRPAQRTWAEVAAKNIYG